MQWESVMKYARFLDRSVQNDGNTDNVVDPEVAQDGGNPGE
jgi:hypothetical protein